MSFPPNRASELGPSVAQTIRQRAGVVLSDFDSVALELRRDNLVRRPWGGHKLLDLKGFSDHELLGLRGDTQGSLTIGESFEVSACPSDPEAARHPSLVHLSDGSEIELQELLTIAGDFIMGPDAARVHPSCLPLLPKFLDMTQSLSVQAHPPGGAEVYFVLEADAGATIRLGFREQVDPVGLSKDLHAGRRAQQQVLELIVAAKDPKLLALSGAMHHALAPVLMDPHAEVERLVGAVAPWLRRTDRSELEAALETLHATCWRVLDMLVEIPVQAGDIIFNAIVDDQGRLGAAIHSLGNPEGKEIQLLEVRTPGSTYRAWDHGRFPLRELAIEQALSSVCLRPSLPQHFMVRKAVSSNHSATQKVVDCDAFTVDYVVPVGSQPIPLRDTPSLRTLHVLSGTAELRDPQTGDNRVFKPGTSVVVPASATRRELLARSCDCRVVVVTLPPADKVSTGRYSPITPPPWLDHAVVPLRFGISGLRGRVVDMSDLEVYINVRGFLRYLSAHGPVTCCAKVAVARDLRHVGAGTGLSSSPRIAAAVMRACRDEGFEPIDCGTVPTPALVLFALGVHGVRAAMPAIMVTGSHMPADRNGLEFFTHDGEVLNAELPNINLAIAERRRDVYNIPGMQALFDGAGMLSHLAAGAAYDPRAAHEYERRFLEPFSATLPLCDLTIVVYQHSSASRDILVNILTGLGARVIAHDRCKLHEFVSVDTEDVSAEQARVYGVVVRHYHADALVSTDGDGARPLLIDEKGRFHHGDELGLVAALYLRAEVVVIPLTASDTIDRFMRDRTQTHDHGPKLRIVTTKVGSSHLIAAMVEEQAAGTGVIVGWDASGGFLTASQVQLGNTQLSPLPTLDGVLPLLAVLLDAAQRQQAISVLFDTTSRRPTRLGLLDAVDPKHSRLFMAQLGGDLGVRSANFGAHTVQWQVSQSSQPEGDSPAMRRDAGDSTIEAVATLQGNDHADPGLAPDEAQMRWRLEVVRERIEQYFGTDAGFGRLNWIDALDGLRMGFESDDIVHLRPSEDASQFRVYCVSTAQIRADQIIDETVTIPGGILRRMVDELQLAPKLEQLAGQRRQDREGLLSNLRQLRSIVAESRGAHQVIAIVNEGDADAIARELERVAPQILRHDGAVQIFAHEEVQPRGQLLGLLDGLRHRRACHGALDRNRVALGIMLPGQGSRMSPLTQSLHGIKSAFPTPVRSHPQGEWLTSAAASLYTWTLVAHHLERLGLRGVAWKWGDEAIVPATRLEALDVDLSRVDAVRFGSNVVVSEQLAAQKEWLITHSDSQRLSMQLRRRPMAELRHALRSEQGSGELRAMVNVGSPAFSHEFLELADAVFGGTRGWLDVDGYLFEALTHDHRAWNAELARDVQLRAFVQAHPDFYAKARHLRGRLETKRGHELQIAVVDFGEGLHWGDLGQLRQAHATFAQLAAPGTTGDFARVLAAFDGVEPDEFGNWIVGDCHISQDVRVRNSVLIDTRVYGSANIDGAVLSHSQLGTATIGRNAVVLHSTVLDLRAGNNSMVFNSIADKLLVLDHGVHTSILRDSQSSESELQSWRADLRCDSSSIDRFYSPVHGNPTSFAEKSAQVRCRLHAPAAIDSAVDQLFRQPLLNRVPSRHHATRSNLGI